MEMTQERLDEFQNLQDILKRKYEIEENLKQLPQSLDASVEALERLKKEYIEKNAVYEKQKQKVEELKAELETTTKEREANEKNMDSIETHRDFEDLDKKIKEAALKEADLRKDLQKEEKILEEANENVNVQQLLVASTEAQVNEQKESLDSDLKAQKEELEDLNKREEEIASLIDPANGKNSETVIKFQRILKRNDEGIVAVSGNVCEGCHMMLPADFANEVRKGKDILFCPYCSRILFYKEAEEGAMSFSMDDLGSLADDDGDTFDDQTDDLDDDNNEDGASERESSYPSYDDFNS